MEKSKFLGILSCLLVGVVAVTAQNPPIPPEPQMPSFEPMRVDKSTTENHDQPKTEDQSINPYGAALQSKKSSDIKRSVSYQTPSQAFNKLSQGNYTLQSSSSIPSKYFNSITYVQNLIKEVGEVDLKINTYYKLPSLKKADADYFESAFQEIVDMLEGRKPLNLRRAIYLTENAWFGGQLEYELFSQMIDKEASLIQTKMKQENLPLNDMQAINFITHQYISDTLEIILKAQEKKVKTFPKSYDFEDPFGKNDASKLFVSKLMFENSGQCKSLPLYFLVLVETLGGEAYLSFSPSHSFVKCKNSNGQLFNIELTNGMLTSDSWVVGSGYVKSEAVKSGIFLDTLNKKQVIANCLVDLARNYRWKYGSPDGQMGYDDFNLKCINQTLKYHPTNIHAILEKSNYYSVLLNYVAYQKGYKTEEDLAKDIQTWELFMQRNKLYAMTDGLGYEPIPEEAYKDWLETLKEKQQQQEHEKELMKFSKITTNY